MNSHTEENYLKAIYKLSTNAGTKGVATTAISDRLNTTAPSVTDMLKKLAAKKLINYKKYQGVALTTLGKEAAIEVIRKHRLWEAFLVEKLNYKWDEVHDIAEQLEHIQSSDLIDRLDKFLEYPKFDPHGDPIPDKNGNIFHHKDISLADMKVGESGVVVGVKDSSPGFLQYLENRKLLLGTPLKVKECFDFDKSAVIVLRDKSEFTVSQQVCRNLYIKRSVKE